MATKSKRLLSRNDRNDIEKAMDAFDPFYCFSRFGEPTDFWVRSTREHKKKYPE